MDPGDYEQPGDMASMDRAGVGVGVGVVADAVVDVEHHHHHHHAEHHGFVAHAVPDESGAEEHMDANGAGMDVVPRDALEAEVDTSRAWVRDIDGQMWQWTYQRVELLILMEHEVEQLVRGVAQQPGVRGRVKPSKKWVMVASKTGFPLTPKQHKNKFNAVKTPFVTYNSLASGVPPTEPLIDSNTGQILEKPAFYDIMEKLHGTSQVRTKIVQKRANGSAGAVNAGYRRGSRSKRGRGGSPGPSGSSEHSDQVGERHRDGSLPDDLLSDYGDEDNNEQDPDRHSSRSTKKRKRDSEKQSLTALLKHLLEQQQKDQREAKHQEAELRKELHRMRLEHEARTEERRQQFEQQLLQLRLELEREARLREERWLELYERLVNK
eukprot:jgi/Chlat1/3232/Chrsp22S03426